MRRTSRMAAALVALLALAALWRTNVRAGEGEAPARRPGGGWSAARRGSAWRGGAEYRDAARHLEARLEATYRQQAEQPHDARLLLRLANLHWQRAYLGALDSYAADPAAARRLEEGDDQAYRAWMRAALLRDASGDLREAARAARRGLARERDPQRRWELLRSLARTECARGRHDLELQALEEGRALRPADPEVLTRLARAYAEVGDPLGAEETLEQVWRRQHGKQTVAPGVSDPSPSTVPSPPVEDRRWASSARDGDEWLAAISRQPSAVSRQPSAKAAADPH